MPDFKFHFPVNVGPTFIGDIVVSGTNDSDGVKITKVEWLRSKDLEPVKVTDLIYYAAPALWEELDQAAYSHCDGDSSPARATGHNHQLANSTPQL